MVVLAKPYLKEEPLIPDFEQNLILRKPEYGNSRHTSPLGVLLFLLSQSLWKRLVLQTCDFALGINVTLALFTQFHLIQSTRLGKLKRSVDGRRACMNLLSLMFTSSLPNPSTPSSTDQIVRNWWHFLLTAPNRHVCTIVYQGHQELSRATIH